MLTNRVMKGILTTKFFEYLAVKRPILSVPGDGDALDQLVRNTQSGEIGISPDEIAQYIKKMYLEWKSNNGCLENVNSMGTEAYSRRASAARLAELLDNALLSDSQ